MPASIDDNDLISNPSGNAEFQDILERRLNRRGLLRLGGALGSFPLLNACGPLLN